MARRSLVALGAVQGSGRGMAEFRDGPFRGRVTLRAVLAEQSEVPVLVPVAGGAIQNHLLRRQVGAALPGFFFAVLLIDPAPEICGRQTVFRLGIRIALELPESDAREGDVIHFCSGRDKPLMFDVAISTRADVGMEGRRLAPSRVRGSAPGSGRRFMSRLNQVSATLRGALPSASARRAARPLSNRARPSRRIAVPACMLE